MKVFGGILGLFVILFVVALLSVNSLVKSAIHTVGPEVVGTPVEIGSVNISLFSGKASLSNITIANPEGFNSDYAFTLGEINTEFQLKSFLNDKVIIEEISILNPIITYEMGANGSNIQALAKHAQSMASSSGGENSNGSGKKIVIKRLSIRGAKVVGAVGDMNHTVTLPDINLTNVGEGGASYAVVGDKILQAVMNELAKQNLKNLLQDPSGQIDGIKDKVKGVTDKLKSLF